MKIIDTKPKPFQRSSCNIWTDPYIQKQMLQEHLNPESDAASRNWASILKIVNFINSHIRPASHILDLGCGPGLYAELFRDQGHEVTGIDFNKASIDYASQRRKDIRYIQDDYILHYPAGNYNAVIMIYCDMGTHSDQERDTLLHHIFDSLTEGGKLIFDVFTEELTKDKKEESKWECSPSGGFWNDSNYLLLSQTFHHPKEKCFTYQYNLLTDDEIKHFIVWDRYYNEEEICTLLKNVGFKSCLVYKDMLDTNNFTSNHEMFVVAEK